MVRVVGVPCFAATVVRMTGKPAPASRLVKTFAATAAAAALAVSFGAPAFADAPASGPLSGTYVSPGDGLGGVIVDANNVSWPAWSNKLTVDGQEVTAYCIQFSADINKTDPYAAKTWAASGAQHLDRVQAIVANHDDYGTPMEDEKWESAATQVAVWSMTDGINPSAVPNATLRNRVNEILAASQSGAEPASTVSLTAAAAPKDSSKSVVVANVATNAGPAANAKVDVTYGSVAATGVTGADGKVNIEIATPSAPTQAKVDVDVAVGSGVVVAPSNGQAMMVADPVNVHRSAAVSLGTPASSPSPSSSPVATPTASPSTAPTAQETPTVQETPTATTPTSLPHTGSSVAPWMFVAALGVAGASAGGFVLVRRRTRR